MNKTEIKLLEKLQILKTSPKNNSEKNEEEINIYL